MEIASSRGQSSTGEAELRAELQRTRDELATVRKNAEATGEQTRLRLEKLEQGAAASSSAVTTCATPPITWRELTPSGGKLRFYGYLRADVQHDSRLPDNSIFAQYARSRDAFLLPASSLTMTPRWSRLGVDQAPSKLGALGGPKMTGKLEIDFYNIENQGLLADSREFPRIRHAWVRADWAQLWLLAGQAADVISPLNPMGGDVSILWNGGNLGDRRPQLQLGWHARPDTSAAGWSFVAAAGQSGAVDNLRDLSLAGAPNPLRGADSGEPTWEGRLGYERAVTGRKDKLQAGLWGHRARQQVDRPIAGRREFRSHSFGADLQVPVASWLTLRGETWTGANLSDVRGGICQGVDATTGKEIRSAGGWGEMAFKLSSRYTLGLGYAEDTPGFRDVSVGGRTGNRVQTVANRYRLGERIELGLDLNRYVTNFSGLRDGEDNRLTFYVQNSF